MSERRQQILSYASYSDPSGLWTDKRTDRQTDIIKQGNVVAAAAKKGGRIL